MNIQLQYTPSVSGGTTPAPQNWYSDYTDFQFLIHNNTHNKWIDSYQFSYPQLQIKETVNPSDELAITVKSASGAFAPYETVVVIDGNNRADLPLTLIERGGLRSSYAKSASAEVLAILYDALGKQVGYQAYSDKSVVWNRLEPADYTLVSIKADNKLRSMAKLSDFEANGLHAGEDYILSALTVSDGSIAYVTIDSIPDFAEMMNYMGNNASFTANKSSLVVGDYLTLRAQLDFQQQYANAVSDAVIVVELPQSVEFIENAILVGGKVGSYSLNGQELTIPMSNYNDLVKFCVIPTNEGSYSVNAYAQFTYQGQTCRQPLGLTTFAVDNASIAAIIKYSANQVIASGLTTPNSAIELYDNDELIAIAKAKPSGSWQIAADLEYAYNLSKHHIYASITTPDGLKMRTKTKNLLYNVSSNPDLRNIEMKVFEGGQLHADVTWDYENNVMTPTFYQYTAAQASFEFYADFAAGQNENIKKVNLILYMHEGKHVLPLKYRADIDKWFGTIGTGMLGETGNGVINVGAEVYMQSTEYLLDAELMSVFYEEIKNPSLGQTGAEEETLFSQLEAAALDGNDELVDSILVALYGETIINDSEPTAIVARDRKIYDYDAILAEADAFLDSINAIRTSNGESVNWEDVTTISDCSGLDSLTLIQQGYELLPKTNGRCMLMLVADDQISIVDFEENIHFSLQLTTSTVQMRHITQRYLERSCNLPQLILPLNQQLNDVNGLIQQLNEIWETLINSLETVSKVGDVVKGKLVDAIKNTPRTDKFTRNKLVVALGRVGKEIESANQWVKRVKLDVFDHIKDEAQKTKLGKIFGKMTSKINVLTLFADAYKLISEDADLVTRFSDLYDIVPHPECEEEALRADALANETCAAGNKVIGHATEGLTYLGVQLGTTIAEIAGAAETAGVSAVFAVVNIVAANAYESRMEKLQKEDREALNKYQKMIANFKWKCEEDPKPEPEPEDPDPDPEPYDLSPIEIDPVFPDLEAHIDPSGFVYEAVEDNRIEGVKATVYYKDTHENMFGEMVEEDVMWNAWDYDQENPQITDAEGKYQWFVPQGLWQVRFEKDGYEPTQSEWLPVPPPQLEVNIPIVQLRQPEVTNAIAHKDAIDITFDKYMMPSLLNTDNIFVTANDQTIAGTIVMLDEQHPYDNTGTSYASKVRFVPAAPFTASEITLTVSTRVHSYADVPLAQTFQQTFDVEDALVIEPAQTPVASIASGSVVEFGTQLTLSCATEGAVIRYTVDGSEPDCQTGYVYSAPIVLYGNGSVTVKAIACAEGYDPSDVAQWTYSFPGQETAIEEVDTNLPQVSKLLRDGQIFILRGDKTYTLQGQEVK